jgi:hypothetical protein
MANYIPQLLTPFLEYTPSENVNEVVSYTSKAMRLLILASRVIPRHSPIPYEKKGHLYKEKGDSMNRGSDTIKLIPPPEPIITVKDREEKDYVKQLNTKPNPETSLTNKPFNSSLIKRESITIVDLDYKKSILDLSTGRYYAYITLPFVPENLDYNPDSNWVAIATMARNNPHYHYTGSEDTLEFDIDWFTNDDLRRDVIMNCRWLESLSKGNGYEETPHRVQLCWGEGANDKSSLFLNDIWVVTKAPYKLSNFNRGFLYTVKGNSMSGIPYSYDPAKKNTSIYQNTHLLPQQAYQRVTLKKITQSNATRGDILGYINTIEPVRSDYVDTIPVGEQNA